MANNPDKPIRGRRNLMILGASSILIAVATTVASLQIYRATGDIYLDRSRPGYIFEDEKHSEEDDQKENFSNEGEINAGVMDEYLKELDTIIERIDDSADDFSPEPLSDDSLNISVDDEEEQQ
ncbi:hypothetical protein IKG13_02320 [Candidatus Saccharibacteria bacterium]|nr:hypothetical protein [Candidatus Saccharibacteria bacterium]MBR3378187.1 hypothetical protein [Candidatus Saccharibacteria bacterium]